MWTYIQKREVLLLLGDVSVDQFTDSVSHILIQMLWKIIPYGLCVEHIDPKTTLFKIVEAKNKSIIYENSWAYPWSPQKYQHAINHHMLKCSLQLISYIVSQWTILRVKELRNSPVHWYISEPEICTSKETFFITVKCSHNMLNYSTILRSLLMMQ